MMRKFCRDLAFRDLHIHLPEDNQMSNSDFLNIQTADSAGNVSEHQCKIAYTLSSLSLEVLSIYPVNLWSELEQL